LRLQVGILVSVQLEGKAVFEPGCIALDLFVQALRRNTEEPSDIFIEHDRNAPDDVNSWRGNSMEYRDRARLFRHIVPQRDITFCDTKFPAVLAMATPDGVAGGNSASQQPATGLELLRSSLHPSSRP